MIRQPFAPGDLTISAIDTQVDFSRIRGGVAVALRRRPGFGIGLSIDRINLDAYLADPTATAPPADAGQTPPESAEPTVDDAAAPALAALALLDRFDAILQLQVGTLTFAGTPASGMSFDGTLQGIALKDAPAFSFQGHPEASPGPHDVAPLFDQFIALMKSQD